MDPDDPDPDDVDERDGRRSERYEPSEPGPLGALTRSARGWHGVQLSVLAFIGLCGVLSDTDDGTPRWLQVTAGVLAIVALVLACASIFLVASVAWPFPTASTAGARGAARDPAAVSHRLRAGVALTYVAVAAMALAASSSWWPTSATSATGDGAAAGPSVQITDHSGNSACGQLVDGPTGRVRLTTSDGTIEVAASGVADIAPVTSC